MTKNNTTVLDFNALLADINNGGASTSEAIKLVKETKRRILREFHHNKDYYLEYAQMVAPSHIHNKAELDLLLQDTVLRAIHNADALTEEQDIKLYLMSEMVAYIDEIDPSEYISIIEMPDEDQASMEKEMHIFRVQQALKNAEKSLERVERALLRAMLDGVLSPDDIPNKLLEKTGLEREDIKEMFFDLFEKLRENKLLRNLHNDRDPDEPHSP